LHELRDTDGAELQQLRVQASRADHLERTCEVYETELQVANTQIQTLKAKLQQYKDQALAMPVQSQQQSLSTSQLHSRSISTATHQPLETSMPLFGTPARQSAQFNTPIASTMSNLSHSSHAVTSSVSSTPSRRDIVLKELLDMRASALDERQRAIMQGRRPTPEMENMLISVESALAKLNS
jgi:crotonobetainyl-CoA:carnitine CoA-transferase CaiB-like acyl-CoA transferase